MHPDFSEWYSAVHPEPSSELISQRIKGIEAHLSKGTIAGDLSLIRLAFEAPVDGQSRETFCQPFKHTDATFRITRNELEHSVLAASTLIEILSKPSVRSMRAALGVACYSFGGIRKPRLTPLLEEATSQHFINSLANSRNSFDTRNLTLPTFAAPDKLNAALRSLGKADAAEFGEKVVSVMTELVEATAKGISEYREAFNLVAARQQQIEEECNILWWLTGGVSRDLHIAFNQLSRAALSLISGKEMADITVVMPGPCAVPAILSAVLKNGTSKKSDRPTLQLTVDASNPDWRRTCLADFDMQSITDFLPIHFALSRSVETGQWSEAFKNVFGLDTSTPQSFEVLALQLYRERLFQRSHASTGD